MLGKTEQVNVGRFFGLKPRTPMAEEIRECFARTLRTEISCNESLEFAGADARAPQPQRTARRRRALADEIIRLYALDAVCGARQRKNYKGEDIRKQTPARTIDQCGEFAAE